MSYNVVELPEKVEVFPHPTPGCGCGREPGLGSGPLDVAEGFGKIQEADRRHFYAIARGSAMECAAICEVIGLVDEKLIEEATPS